MSPAMAQQTWPFLPMFRRNPTGHGLFSCLFLSVFLYTSALSAQDISAVKKDSLVADQLELDSTWKGKPDISGVAFNNFHIGNNWDLLLTPAQKKRRTWLIGGANVVGYGGTMIGLYSAWYKNMTGLFLNLLLIIPGPWRIHISPFLAMKLTKS